MTRTVLLGSRLALVVSLLVLVPRAGLAQEEAPTPPPASGSTASESPNLTPPTSGVPGTGERAPLRLMEAPATEPAPIHPALRILAETGGGLVTSALGGIVGGALGLGLGAMATPSGTGSSTQGWGPVIGLLLGGATGLAVGYPIGVWWGGESAGGNGRLLASLGGGLVGILAGTLVTSLSHQSNLSITIPLLGMIGSTVGYELSLRPAEAPRSGRVSARARLQPTLAFSSQGAMLGLSGGF